MKNEIVSYHDNNPVIPRQASTDEQAIALWLHNRPKTTQRVYINDIEQFLTFVNKSLPETILSDLQAFSDSLQDRKLAPATQHRMLSAVKCPASTIISLQRQLFLPFSYHNSPMN